MKFYKLALTWMGGFLLLGWMAFAQSPTASVSGVVQDESGAVIPGAKVTVTNVDQGISRVVATEAAGRYHVPGLIPGNYEVQAQMEGFQTEVRKGIQLTVGMNAVINLPLRVGQVTQTTVVTAQAPLVDTVTGTVSGLVDDRAIRDLPLNGRSYEQLISLQSSTPTFSYRDKSFSAGRSATFSMNGGRGGSNSFMMDGVESAGEKVAVPGGSLGKNMGVEAIREFSILTTNYSVAFGKKAGGVINVATRSGTNQLHGSAYEFLRNDNLDARNFFDQTPRPPEFKRNQFGTSIGGAIRKDRTFFFGNYEGLRENLGLTNIAIVPDDNARQGLLPDPQRPGQIRNVGVAPSVAPFLAAFPRANGRVFGDGTAEYLSSPSQTSRQDFVLARVDHKISERDSVFGRFNFGHASLLQPELNPNFAVSNPGRDWLATVQAMRAYPTLLNSLRLSFVRGWVINDAVVTIPLDSNLVFFPGAKSMGAINFGGGSGLNQLTVAGARGSSDRFAYTNQYEVGEQVNYYRGAHSFQFGGNYQRIQHNNDEVSSKRGSFRFTGDSLANFLTGRPATFTGPDPSGGGDSTKAYRHHYLGAFLQDDWKALSNLTLNLGVRYEFLTSPTEASGNRISNYRIDRVNGLAVIRTEPVLGSPIYYTNFATVAPRVGFAWDTFGNGKLAVRGGIGVFYDQIEHTGSGNLFGNPPFFKLREVANPNFPLGFSGPVGQTGLPAPEGGVDVNAKAGTVLMYNLGIEREITSNTLFKIGYVGSGATHLFRSADMNTVAPQMQSGGVYFYPAGAPRRNPGLPSTRFKLTDANSSYNSLQMDFVQRLSGGLRYKLSYTFSKAMDTSSINAGPEARNTSASTMIADNQKADRALSAFDIRHNFVSNFTYDLPSFKLSGAARQVLGGWQVGTIVTMGAGFPANIFTSFNRSRDGNTSSTVDRPSLAPGRSNNPVLGGPDKYFDPTAFLLPPAGFYGNLGRNTLIAPGLVNVDFTLVKMFPMTERVKLDFRAEFFNLLNHANFGLPSLNIFQSSGAYLGAAGRISTTTTTSRQIQFGLKLSF